MGGQCDDEGEATAVVENQRNKSSTSVTLWRLQEVQGSIHRHEQLEAAYVLAILSEIL